MMKRICSFLLVIFLLPVYLLNVNAEDADARVESVKPAALFVGGNRIDGEHQAVFHLDESQNMISFDIPLVATLKALGGSVIWVCESRAIIFYKGFVLQLDTKRESVYFLSPEQNYFELVGGTGPIVRTRRQEGHDYIIDDSAAQSFFTLLEVRMICDEEDAIIRIDAEGRAPGLSFLLNAMVVIFGLPFLAMNPFRFH